MRQVDSDQVGLLADLDGADALAESQRAGAVDRCHADAVLGVAGAGVASNRLGQQRRAAHFAEHVEVIVAGGAIGAEADIDRLLVQLV